jgi:hypothetical protein
MKLKNKTRLCLLSVLAEGVCVLAEPVSACGRVEQVMAIPGVVAFWDFVEREAAGEKRFIAHVPPGKGGPYALEAGNYVKTFWGEGREATYADFPLLGNGPFGEAIQIRAEEDPTFRPYLYVPRDQLHDTPLDIKGMDASVTVVVWAIRESGNHALAGIWHEGTDLKQASTEGIRRVERGQRQYALFAGLNTSGAACGHVSENGIGSFHFKYAMHKSNSGEVSKAVPSSAPLEVLAGAWECFAMSLDNERDELTSWLNGRASERWQTDVQKRLPAVYNAWRQGMLRKIPGLQEGEDPKYTPAQDYNPPEDAPLSVERLSEDASSRVERHTFRYTKVRVSFAKNDDGTFQETGRDLDAVRLNPWWYPHGIYSPPDAQSGGPFTIGRVIHSSRSVGFTGWIGGVAVFDRALTAEEHARLARLSTH